MTGPFCSSCGATVAGVRFCTSCGTPVQAPPADPYEYLFAEPSRGAPAAGPTPPPPAWTPPAAPPPDAAEPAADWGPEFAPEPTPMPEGHEEYATTVRPAIRWDQQPPAPVIRARPRRRSFGWPWVAAASVVLAVVIGFGLALTVGGGGSHSAGDTPPSGPTHGAGNGSGTGSGTGSSKKHSAPAKGSPQAAAVAKQVRGLLVHEVRAHQADNAAVGAMLGCTNMATNRVAIASFAGVRRDLVQELATVPSSGDPRLDGVVHRLLGTWRSLLPIDRAYTTWARGVRGNHHKCHAPAAPSTSTASKNQRHALRNAWVNLVRAHPQWRVHQVPALGPSGRGLGYMLL